MIELQVDAAGLQQAAREMGATGAQVQQALRSTVGKMTRWARTRSVRDLGKGLVVPQKVLRPRVKARRLQRTARGAEAGVWYGLNPVALIRLGARQTRTGVSARGGRKVQGAFIARARGGGPQVFKRKGRERLPIAMQAADIEARAADYIQDDLAESRAFEQQFRRVFEHEIQWRMRKR